MSATLTDSTHLLVPIHVDALLVGAKPRHFSWTDLSPDYTKLERDFFLGADLRDLSGSSSAPGQGLHLHFKLPAALTHGTSTGAGAELVFPRLPNRWLVVRYYQPQSKTNILTKAWIIRSDAAGPDDAVGWPVLPDTKDAGPLRIRRTGKCDVLPQSPFKEDDIAAALTITAVGNGDAGFSAHYPACYSILGFHDDLKNPDVPAKTKLSYLVAGWYSAATDDFLQIFINGLDPKLDDQGKLAALRQWLKDKGWSAGLEPGKLPSRMICHGLVRGVDWQGSQRDYSDIEAFDGIDSPAGHTVDIGNSSAEALAARLVLASAQKTHSDPELLEDVLTAFQTGLLSNDPTIAELDAELHRQGFVPVETGKTFLIQSESSASDRSDVAQPHEPVPQHLQDLLTDLNSCQQECDRYAQLKKDYRWELYALWHRWVEKCKEFDDAAALLKSNLDGLKTFLQNFDQLPQLVEARNRRQAAEDRLSQALADETTPKQNDNETIQVPKYRLTSSAADRFYTPNDPVVLISGPALERKGTYTPSPADILPCRATGQEVLSYSYDISDGQHGIVVTAADQIKSLGIESASLNALPFFAQQLFSEAMLLEQIEQAGSQPSDIGWRARPSPSDKSLPRIDNKSRMPAAIGLFDWTHNPWIPVYLTWRFEWHSDYAAVADSGSQANIDVGAWRLQGDREDAGSDEWKYRRQVDLTPDGPPPTQAEATSPTYRGFALLARPTFLALAEKLRREPDKIPPRVKEIAVPLQALLENRPMLSQALAGFNDGLIMRRVGDQLPPFDYNRFDPKIGFFVDPIHDAMQPEDRFDYSPATDFPFCPIRSGRLKLLSLRIIDAFGQAISLDPGAKTACHAGQRIRADANGTGGPSNTDPLRLPPRLVRPMRLIFANAPAGNPTTVAPTSSPICGWIVPNQFDQNLTLYAANGKPLGALQRKFELKAGSTQNFFYWVDVPGTVDAPIQRDWLDSGGIAFSEALEKHLEETIANLHLRDFARYVLGLNGDQGAAFSALLDRALTATEQRVPEDDPGVSVLIGRPLALVRAEVRLEISGLPALDQKLSWTASATDSAINQLLNANGLAQFPQDQLNTLLQTGGAENVRWPVRLGDRRSANDGLIGFFAGDPSETSRPFYASWGFGGTRYEKILEYEQNLTVDCRHPFQVTLLMDPQARVHATCGVLPKGFLALPHSESAGAKGAREVFFQTAPVLGPPATPQIPKPSDDYGEWSWAYRPDVTRWAEHGDLVSASDRGGFSDTYPTIAEGWLKLKIDPVQVLGFWVRDGSTQAGHPTLAWSIRGAESLQLFRKTVGSPARVLEMEWSQAPLPREFTLQKSVDADTVFILAAADDAGYRDEKEIVIKRNTNA
ncbi:MAG: hypothetical protein WAQ99_12670 [Pyrinomonadaceae bacterium]